MTRMYLISLCTKNVKHPSESKTQCTKPPDALILKKYILLALPDCHSGELKHFVVSMCECCRLRCSQLGRVQALGQTPGQGRPLTESLQFKSPAV